MLAQGNVTMVPSHFNGDESSPEKPVILVLATIVLVSTAGVVWQALYRLFFHPLAKVPGPKLAALTDFWRMFHEIKGVLPFG
jgi:hypothetical protein